MFDLPNPRHIQHPLIQNVVDALLGKGTCPSTGRSAARTSQVMDAVLAEYYGGLEDGFWKREWPGNTAAHAGANVTGFGDGDEQTSPLRFITRVGAICGESSQFCL